MIAQLDLFGATQPSPPPPPPVVTAKARPAEIIPRPPTVEWERLLRRYAEISTTVMVQCSTLWTGVVLEALTRGNDQQYWLMGDKTIREMKPSPGEQAARYVYIRPRDALALHAKHPMIKIRGGTHSCMYRFAEPGEDAPADLPLPPMTIGPEVD
jgi:hypothetical protein